MGKMSRANKLVWAVTTYSPKLLASMFGGSPRDYRKKKGKPRANKAKA